LPASSSDNRPDMRNRDSIRPSRFSRPSMYLALVTSQCATLTVSNGCSLTLWEDFSSSPLV
jgi:hypothetical protein